MSMQSNAEKLQSKMLPCPFCGYKPLYAVSAGGKHHIDCGVEDCCIAGVSRLTKFAAIAAWNARVTPTIVTELVASLRQVTKLLEESTMMERSSVDCDAIDHAEALIERAAV